MDIERRLRPYDGSVPIHASLFLPYIYHSLCSQVDMPPHTGALRETVNKKLGELAARGLVLIGRAEIGMRRGRWGGPGGGARGLRERGMDVAGC